MHTLARRSGALAVSALLTMAVAGIAWSQAVPGTPPAPAPQTTPATLPATAEGSATRPGISGRMRFAFTDAQADTILNAMSENYGFIIIKTQQIPGRITVSSRGEELDADQAINLINGVLNPLGYGTLETLTTPPNQRTILRIATVAEIKKAQIPVFVGADPNTIELTDRIITQIIPLKTIDAVRLRADLSPLLSADADVAANAGSNSIIITDTSAKIHRLAEIIRGLDSQSQTQTRIHQQQLKFSSAQDAARLINAVFAPQNTAPAGAATPGRGGAGAAGGRGGGGGGAFGAQGAAGSTGVSDYARSARLYADYDPRTNTVVLNGPNEAVDKAISLLNEIDRDPITDTVFFIYPLKNAQAIYLEPVLNRVFGTGAVGGFGGAANRGTTAGGVFGATGRGATGRGATGATGRGATGRGAAAGGGGRAAGGGFGAAGGGFGATGGGFGGARGGVTQIGGGARGGTTGSSSLLGEVFVVANQDTNALLVTTNTKLEDQVKDILDKLDRPIPQVLIKVLVAEVTHTNSDDIGFQFSAANLTNGEGEGIVAGTDYGLSTPTAGGIRIGLVESQVNATLQALAGQNKLDVLSRPYILAQDNQLAQMNVGQSVPYIASSTITNTGIVNVPNWYDVGISLQVIPHINPEGLVTLDVYPSISQLDTGSGVQIQTGIFAPTFTNRYAQTRVAVPNGQTIVIGGLMQDSKSEIVQKVPVLGDIPYLGMLFKRTRNNKQKTELLIFITPHVALAPEVLRGMSSEETRALKLVPTAIQPGVWEDQMQGMERGATTTRPAEEFRLESGRIRP
jgi:general secretion pathway protein D